MKIVVLGSGVIGVTSAYYLARAGHEVTVLDRQPGPALETSFANAGEICPGFATPWAAPGLPLKALKWIFAEHAPLILRPRLEWAMASWLLAMLRNCSAERYAANRSRMTRLAEYSRGELAALRAATGIAYDERQQGSLQLFRTARQADEASRDVAVLRASGLAFELLDAAACIAAEPALAKVRERIAGGLRMPGDETGDCFKFTVALAELTARYGASFRHGVTVRRLLTEGERVTGIETDADVVVADAYVAALGSFTPALLAPLGLAVPIYPVKGYSITVPIDDATSAPVSTVIDETYKIAITRLGARMRVGGMAEISGFGMGLPAARRATLEKCASEIFPDAGALASATFWTGLRPMIPDGAPAIGRTRLANLFVNAGHGTLGWTMACGSGRVLADLVSGRRPAIEVADLSPARFAGAA